MRLRKIIQELKANGQFALVQRRQAKVAGEKPGARKFLADMVFGQGLNIALPTTGGDNPYPPSKKTAAQRFTSKLLELASTEQTQKFKRCMTAANENVLLVLLAELEENCLSAASYLFILFWQEYGFGAIPLEQFQAFCQNVGDSNFELGLEKLINGGICRLDEVGGRKILTPCLTRFAGQPDKFFELFAYAATLANGDKFPLIIRRAHNEGFVQIQAAESADFLEQMTEFATLFKAHLLPELTSGQDLSPLERSLMGLMLDVAMCRELAMVKTVRDVRMHTKQLTADRKQLLLACGKYGEIFSDLERVALFERRMVIWNSLANEIAGPRRLVIIGPESSPVRLFEFAHVDRQCQVADRFLLGLQPILWRDGQVLPDDQLYLGGTTTDHLQLHHGLLQNILTSFDQRVTARDLDLHHYVAMRLIRGRGRQSLLLEGYKNIAWQRFVAETVLVLEGVSRDDLSAYSGRVVRNAGQTLDAQSGQRMDLGVLRHLLVDYPLLAKSGVAEDLSLVGKLMKKKEQDLSNPTLLAYLFHNFFLFSDLRSTIVFCFFLMCIERVDSETGRITFDQTKVAELPKLLEQVFAGEPGSILGALKNPPADLSCDELGHRAANYFSEAIDGKPLSFQSADVEHTRGVLLSAVINLADVKGFLDLAAIKKCLFYVFWLNGCGSKALPLAQIDFGLAGVGTNGKKSLASYLVAEGVLVLDDQGNFALAEQERQAVIDAALEYRESMISSLKVRSGVSWPRGSGKGIMPGTTGELRLLKLDPSTHSAAFKVPINQEILERFLVANEPLCIGFLEETNGYFIAPSLARKFRGVDGLTCLIEPNESGVPTLTVLCAGEELFSDSWLGIRSGDLMSGQVNEQVKRGAMPKSDGFLIAGATADLMPAVAMVTKHLEGFKSLGLVVGEMVWSGYAKLPLARLADMTEDKALSLALDTRLAIIPDQVEREALLLDLFAKNPQAGIVAKMQEIESGTKRVARTMAAVRRIARYAETRKVRILPLLISMLLTEDQVVAEGRFCAASGTQQSLRGFDKKKFTGTGAALVDQANVSPSGANVSFNFSAAPSGEMLVYVFRSRGGVEYEDLFKLSDGQRFSEHDVLDRELRPVESEHKVSLRGLRKLGIAQARQGLQSVSHVLDLWQSAEFWEEACLERADLPHASADQVVRQALVDGLAPELVGLSETQRQRVMSGVVEELSYLKVSSSPAEWSEFVRLVGGLGVRVNLNQLKVGNNQGLGRWLSGLKDWLAAAEAAERAKSGAKTGVAMIGPTFRSSAKDLKSLSDAEVLQLVMHYKMKVAAAEKQAAATVTTMIPAVVKQQATRLQGAAQVAQQVRAEHDPLGALKNRIIKAGDIFAGFPKVGEGVERALLDAVFALDKYPDSGVLTPIRMLAEVLHSLQTGDRLGRIQDVTPSDSLSGHQLPDLTILAFPWTFYNQKFWGRLVLRSRQTGIGQARIGLNLYGGKKLTLNEFARDGRVETAGLRIDYEPRFGQPVIDIGGEEPDRPLSEALAEVRTSKWHFGGYLPKQFNRRAEFAQLVNTFSAQMRQKIS